jgi:hypothetical protein
MLNLRWKGRKKPEPVAGPTTIVGHMLKAIARRDNEVFVRWRAELNKNKAAQRILYPVLYETFRAAVEQRFAEGEDVRNITRFLNQPRLLLWPEAGFPIIEAEALIRSALGEQGLVDGISTENVVRIRYQLLTYLVEDLRLTDTELDTLIVDSERWVAENE